MLKEKSQLVSQFENRAVELILKTHEKFELLN